MSEVAEPEYPMFDKHTEALEVGFFDNLKIPLKNMISLKVLISVILAILSLVLVMFVLDFVVDKLAQNGIKLEFPLLCLLMLSIPAWTISFASTTLLEKKRKLNASGTLGILGRYVGTVISGVILMTIIYAAVYAIWYYMKGDLGIDLVNSYIIMVAFVALAAAIALFFNAVFVHAGFFTYLVLFIGIPILAFYLGPYAGIMEMNEVTNYLPLVDMISSTATDGFGGGTVLTLTFAVKSSPPVMADVMGTVVLTLGWAALFVALAILVQAWREKRHDQQ